MTTAAHMGGDTRWARMSGLLVAGGWGCHLGCLWLRGACAGCPAAGQAHWVGNAAQGAMQRGIARKTSGAPAQEACGEGLPEHGFACAHGLALPPVDVSRLCRLMISLLPQPNCVQLSSNWHELLVSQAKLRSIEF